MLSYILSLFFVPLSYCWLADSVERFHISACILFVLAQNILEAEGPWFISFISVSLFKFVTPKIYSMSFSGEINFIAWFGLALITVILYDAEYPLGLSIWDGYRCDQAFIHCQIQQHFANCIFWVSWSPM